MREKKDVGRYFCTYLRVGMTDISGCIDTEYIRYIEGDTPSFFAKLYDIETNTYIEFDDFDDFCQFYGYRNVAIYNEIDLSLVKYLAKGKVVYTDEKPDIRGRIGDVLADGYSVTDCTHSINTSMSAVMNVAHFIVKYNISLDSILWGNSIVLPCTFVQSPCVVSWDLIGDMSEIRGAFAKAYLVGGMHET